MKYCSFNGCQNKITKGQYCSDHKRSRPKKKKPTTIYHSKNKAFYNSNAWQSMRSFVYERERGCCQRCGKFIFGRNAHVHHVVPVQKDKTLALEPNNLRLLCRDCHMIEENEGDSPLVVASYFRR